MGIILNGCNLLNFIINLIQLCVTLHIFYHTTYRNIRPYIYIYIYVDYDHKFHSISMDISQIK